MNNMEPVIGDFLKVLLPTILTFIIGIVITPSVSKWLYTKKLWKQTARQIDNPEEMSPTYLAIHNTKEEKNTPRIGGVIIWGSVIITTAIVFLFSLITPTTFTEKINFLSRNQTLLLIGSLLSGAVVGLIDDMMQINNSRNKNAHGFPGWTFAAVVGLLGFAAACWFFFKLDVSSINIPFWGNLALGWWFIPFFVLVTLGVFSSGVIDGIDGLSGGVFAIVFAAFGVIAFLQSQIDIATFSFVVTGGILAFLWFNVPPARFYMGETGMLALTLTLTLIAFLTGHVLLLLVIGFPLVASSLSSAIQIVAKKYWRVKIFKVAPLHHHFQAIGWSREKIVMRYWIVTTMFAVIGIIIAIIG